MKAIIRRIINWAYGFNVLVESFTLHNAIINTNITMHDLFMMKHEEVERLKDIIQKKQELGKQGEQKPTDKPISREEILNQLFQNGTITMSDFLYLTQEHKSGSWSEEDEEMAEDLIKGCVSAEKAHHFLHTPHEVTVWLKSIKDRMKGKED